MVKFISKIQNSDIILEMMFDKYKYSLFEKCIEYGAMSIKTIGGSTNYSYISASWNKVLYISNFKALLHAVETGFPG